MLGRFDHSFSYAFNELPLALAAVDVIELGVDHCSVAWKAEFRVSHETEGATN